MTPKLQLVALRKEYDDGQVVAVDDVSLELEAGDTLALLGPSGCGKSTTLNMSVGLETPTSGDILIDGQSVTGVLAGRRNVGLVFQDYAVFTHLSVERNLAFGLEVRGVRRAEIQKRVAETAELLGLGAILKVRASRLGGSELQRVAIGRTLVTRPTLLLLDEPLSNLEAEMRATMRRELRRLQAETGLTIVYVTHDQVEALSLARRIAVMSNGKLRQCAATETVYARPGHTFVAGFIGEPPMNLFDAVLEHAATGPVVRAGELVLPVAGPVAGAPDSGRVVVGLRPDSLRLATAGSALWQGHVLRREPRGAEAVVTVGADRLLLQVIAETHAAPEVGEPVGLEIDLARLVLFHGDTRCNLAEAGG